MTKLTTPKSILIGFALIAISIASIPYSNLIVPRAYADDYDVINLYETNDELLKNLDQNLIFQNDSHFNEYGNLMIFQLLKRDLLKQNEEEFLFLEDIKRKIDKLYN